MPAVATRRSELVSAWILAQGRFAADLPAFVTDVFARWRGEGMPIDRASLSLLAIHPQIRATNIYWHSSEGAVEITRSHDVAGSETYLRSPIKRIHDGEEF